MDVDIYDVANFSSPSKLVLKSREFDDFSAKLRFVESRPLLLN